MNATNVNAKGERTGGNHAHSTLENKGGGGNGDALRSSAGN